MNIMRYLLQNTFWYSKLFSRKNLYGFLHEELSTYIGEKRVLNIGSGGEIGEIFKNAYKHFNLITIDVDSTRNPDIVMDACSLKFPDNSFDLVCMMEVLEHISTPYLAISEIYRVLKPSGKLIMSTPFLFGIHDAPHDYYRYTKYGLMYLLNEFIHTDVRERNAYISTVIVLLSRLITSESKRDKLIGIIFTYLSVLLFPLIWLLDNIILTRNITTGYFVVARK